MRQPRSRIYITDNRSDKVLLPDFMRSLAVTLRGMAVVDGHAPVLERLEKRLADFIGMKACQLTASGTDALQLALLLLGLQKGDEVIIPATTYISVGLAIHYAGGTVVPVDVSAQDMLASASAVAARITRRTRAIMMIHMFGQCCDVDGFMALSGKSGIPVIENACQAFGTRFNGSCVGSFGDLSALSFRYAKTLSSMSGAGGALLMRQGRLKKRASMRYMDIFRADPGLASLGGKMSRISFLDAVSVGVKLDHAAAIMEAKRRCLRAYETSLAGVGAVQFFRDPPGVDSVRPFFLVLARHRDRLNKFLLQAGIRCEVSYPSITDYTPLGRFPPRDFPVAMRHARMALRLPLFPLMEVDEALWVAEKVKEFYARS